ncbi:unnamed protein product [Trypanosoma congolense IL3000]|uniref:WGS project CAEQ00000000 data, annotated contig 465 n=1 Tax=Trypanosoma congolense (strain IL3000) TaxID=1068625 RepID=F9WG51_TRYCI|nr:unnamed protein product [Trypanosoma congolense IL3000]
MSGRLRDSLYSYFAKHIECGDWISCLRVLRGCTAAGTPLHSLPYKTLFPLLVVNGQWESVLRLSSQLESGVGASASARASGGAKNDEAELCNALLRAALAPEALTDGGSWRAAVYVVQYAARKQLMLEPEVVRGMLRATESWSCGACSGAGGASSCLNDSVRSDDQRKKDELLLARDTLLGMQLLGGKSFPACIAETCEVRESSKSPTIQVEMVLAVGEVFEESLKGDGSAASLCWSRLREQMRTIFALSWENAVYTLLRLCHCVHNATGVEMESHESIERVAEGHDLASLMRFVAINAAAQPHITRQILHMALECLLDGNVVHVPHARATASGDPTDCDDAIMTSLPPWCAQLKRGWGAAAATELAKWRAVLSLVLTEVEQHERCWELEGSSPRLHRPSKRFLWRDGLTSLMMLSASARLVILGEMGVGEEHSGRLPCSAEPELLERVMRVLLFQGSLVATGASTDGYERRRRDAIIESVVETVQSIMDVFIFGFHSTNKCHVAEPAGTQERSGHPALPFDNVSGSSATDLKGGVRLAVSCARANLWANVLFPNKTYLSYDAHGGGGLCVLVAWQEILRDVFSNVSTLTMLFDDSDYVYRTSKGGYSCHTPTASSSTSSGRELSDDPAGNQVSVHAGERKKTHVSKGAVFLSTEAMKHLEELIDFISTPVTRDPKMDASNKPYKYCTFNQRYCSDHYKWRVPPVQWCVNRIDTGGEVSNALSVPGLLTLLKHQYDTNRLGEALLQRYLKTDNGAAAVTGVTTALRLLIASIAKSHVKGLLRHLLKITTEGEVASQWQFCRLAVVAVLHETDAFHPGQKVRYTMQLLDSVEPRSKVWEASLLLFREAAISICRQHHEARQGSVVDGDSPIGRVSERNGTTTLSYIMDTLVAQSTPPRWCDALQIVEVLHWIAPCAGSVSGQSEKMVNNIPLSESEHIDLCEALASLRHRHQWADAAQLFKQYESRPLSNHDIAHFAFTFSRAPLSFIRRVLLKLDQQKNREVARTALEACARYVRKAELTDRILVCAHYDEKKSSQLREGKHLCRKSRNCHSEELDADALAQEQRRYILLHDVADVMLLALKSWPVPVTEESQFAYIWRTVLRGCAGDAEMARLLLKQSSIYNTAELQTEVMELMHTIALCHRTQDVGSAVSAYKQFCRRRMGLSVPRDTMLKLVELCVLGLDGEEEIGGRKADGSALDNVSLLCTVLVDTLAMHTIAENVGFKKDTSEERSIMVQVCTALFSLTEFPSVADNMMAFGADTFVDMIPKFKASMGPGVRRHGLRILQILTDHLVRSKAKFLRDLPSFVGVLLCASRELSIVASVNGQEGSVLFSLAELVEVLQNHIRNLEGQFGRLVPIACSFWLKVLKYSASERLCGRKIHFGGVGADSSVWSPTRLILENNTANFCVTQSLFQQVILRAMDDICREERTSVSVTYTTEHDALLRGKLMPHAIDAVIHMLHCRWGSHPPPAAILTGVSLLLQQVRLQRAASSNNTGVGMYCAASLYELTSLQSTLSISTLDTRWRTWQRLGLRGVSSHLPSRLL